MEDSVPGGIQPESSQTFYASALGLSKIDEHWCALARPFYRDEEENLDNSGELLDETLAPLGEKDIEFLKKIFSDEPATDDSLFHGVFPPVSPSKKSIEGTDNTPGKRRNQTRIARLFEKSPLKKGRFTLDQNEVLAFYHKNGQNIKLTAGHFNVSREAIEYRVVDGYKEKRREKARAAKRRK